MVVRRALRSPPRALLVAACLVWACAGCSGGGVALGGVLGEALHGAMTSSAKEASREREPTPEEIDRECAALLPQVEQHYDSELAVVYALPIEDGEQADVAFAAYDHLADELRGAIPDRCREPRRGERWAALAARLDDHEHLLRLHAAARLVDAGQPLPARTIFWRYYDGGDRATPAPRLRELARAIAAGWDAELLERFRGLGGYGELGGAGERRGCVFSPDPLPVDLATVEPVFATHIEATAVEVVCRLPAAAAQYEAGIDPRLAVQLLAAEPGGEHVLATHTAGRPLDLGDARYLRARFTLPPEADQGQLRGWYDARMVVSRSFPDAAGQLVQNVQELGRASFSWHAPGP